MGKNGKSRNKWRRNANQNRYRGNSSSSNQAQEDTWESDIPGFYFDEEKKAYFKILPNQMTSVGSFVTKETIRKKRDEKQRISDLNGESSKTHSTVIDTISAQRRKRKSNDLVKPLLDVLHSMQCGRQTCQTLNNYLLKQRCLGLKQQSGWDSGRRIDIAEFDIPFEGIRKFEVTDERDKAVVVWSQRGFMSQYIKLLNLKAKRKQVSSDIGTHLNLTIEDTGFQGVSADKVTSLSWCSLPGIPGKTCLLLTSVCPVGYSRSRASIFDLEASGVEQSHLFSYDLGKTVIWSCAWNHQKSRLSVGCEKKCHVVDVLSRSKWTYSTNNSDSLAQLFSHTNPHVLYAGTRNGFVLVVDLRSSSHTHGGCKVNQKNPVVCLKSLKDENYLLASDFSGLIKMWDLRVQKSVNCYNGLVNSHHQIPFYLDDSEKFICASGTNCYSHIWDLSSGALLKTLPPPMKLQQDYCAISHISHSWDGMAGNFGVVTAMVDRFFLYS